MVHYETDDLVIALGLILPAIQAPLLLAVSLLSRPLTKATQPYLAGVTRQRDVAQMKKGIAFLFGFAALFIFLIFRGQMLLPSAEVDRYQNQRDFGDFLLQTIRPLGGYDLFVLLSLGCLLALAAKARKTATPAV